MVKICVKAGSFLKVTLLVMVDLGIEYRSMGTQRLFSSSLYRIMYISQLGHHPSSGGAGIIHRTGSRRRVVANDYSQYCIIANVPSPEKAIT